MYHGILPVYKSRGLTSHDVVFKLRKILKTKKIGHTGTLDPEVDGVLPICIGQATKVSDYVMDMGKTYIAEVTIGQSTTTEDQTGDTLETKDVTSDELNAQQIDDVLAMFEGTITQIPPMYSSVKVKGKKLYEYARQGQTVERPSRQVTIAMIRRRSDVTFDGNTARFEIEVACGKGTYIRTLATDIGKALGFPAHMSQLTRTNSGGFDLEQSLSLQDIQAHHEQNSLQNHLLPLSYGLKALPAIRVTDDRLKQRILNGQKLNRAQFDIALTTQFTLIDDATDDVLAIYEPHPTQSSEVKPKKVFN